MIENVKKVWNMSTNVRTQCHGSTSFLKSPMVWKNKNRKKSWKTPPKELFKEATHKISRSCDDWKDSKKWKHCNRWKDKSTSFLKSQKVRKNRIREKSWKIQPKELFKECTLKILWSCDDWKDSKKWKHCKRMCDVRTQSYGKVLAF